MPFYVARVVASAMPMYGPWLNQQHIICGDASFIWPDLHMVRLCCTLRATGQALLAFMCLLFLTYLPWNATLLFFLCFFSCSWHVKPNFTCVRLLCSSLGPLWSSCDDTVKVLAFDPVVVSWAWALGEWSIVWCEVIHFHWCGIIVLRFTLC